MKDLCITKYIHTSIIFFSKFPCSFRKGFNAQHCLITIIEKWRRSNDEGGNQSTLLTDLSKAFDCIDLELLIAKLYSHGFDKYTFYFTNSYLEEQKQITKKNSPYSEILFSVPQGCILGPLLFNICICDLFFENGGTDIPNYVDDKTPYVRSSDLHCVIFKLQKAPKEF